MLPIILLLSLLYQVGHALDYGTDFITAFPENIAYYFPGDTKLLIKCTALHDNTKVNISGIPSFINLNKGQENTTEIRNMEESLLGPSNKTVRITSNKNITVIAITKRGDSIQSTVVLPVTSLDITYFIPFPNYTLLTSQLNTYQPSDWSSSALIFNFRLMIINAEGQSNTVKVTSKGGASTGSPFTIEPFQMIQIQSTDPWVKVTSDAKVAVILTHPCVDTLSCRCNMIMHQIRPASSHGTEFIVPPFVNPNISRLFVTSGEQVDLKFGSDTKPVQPGSLDLLSFLPTSASTTGITLTKAGSLRLIRPGMMLDFIPTSMFASCYLVSLSSRTKSQVLLIVPTAETGNIRQDANTPLATLTWTHITSAGYSWALMDLTNRQSSVIWHPNSKIGVYLFEKSPSGITYGGPAIALSDEPDPRGCVVSKDVFQIFNDTLSWQASRALCQSKNMVLASPSFNFTQNKMATLLKDSLEDGDMWLGLRRDLVSNVWYWQDDSIFDFANWADGHPDKLSNDFCVSTNMDQNFVWNCERCCNTLKPLCSRKPDILYRISTLNQPFNDGWSSTTIPGLTQMAGTIE